MIAIWDARLSVGDSVIDAEHRQVISILNEIDVAGSVGAPPEVIAQALDSLARAITAHFARDDRPHGEHAAITVSAQRLRDGWRLGGARTIDRRVLQNLASRWIGHMGRREAGPVSQRLAG